MTVPAAPGGSLRRGVRLTRRGRVLLRLMVGIVATVGVVLFVNVRSGAQDAGQAPATDAAATSGSSALAAGYMTVVPGDTLWAIAVRIQPDTDPRAVVQALSEVNGLDSPVIQPGQRLILPARP